MSRSSVQSHSAMRVCSLWPWSNSWPVLTWKEGFKKWGQEHVRMERNSTLYVRMHLSISLCRRSMSPLISPCLSKVFILFRLAHSSTFSWTLCKILHQSTCSSEWSTTRVDVTDCWASLHASVFVGTVSGLSSLRDWPRDYSTRLSTSICAATGVSIISSNERKEFPHLIDLDILNMDQDIVHCMSSYSAVCHQFWGSDAPRPATASRSTLIGVED